MSTDYIVLLFYDIPNNCKEENKQYIRFRRFIIASGFVMLQESMYMKSVKTKSKYNSLKRDMKLASPKDSNIRSILLTEKIYNEMEIIKGDLTISEKIISKKTRILEF